MSEQPDRPTPLEPLDEDWQTALCVVAHPDDLEFGAAAAVARWTGQGKRRRLLHGHQRRGRHRRHAPGRVPHRPRGRAGRVGTASSASTRSTSSGCPTGSSSTASRCALRSPSVVRRHRPDIVITGNFRDTWGGSNLNQADHIAVGRAVLDAVRDAGNRWVFADQLTDGLEPWGGVRAVWAAGSPQSGHAVDTTDTFEAGRRLARGTPRLHRRPRLGALRPARVPRGHLARDRSAPRRGVRGAVRGLPDGLGRVAALTAGRGSRRTSRSGATRSRGCPSPSPSAGACPRRWSRCWRSRRHRDGSAPSSRSTDRSRRPMPRRCRTRPRPAP